MFNLDFIKSLPAQIRLSDGTIAAASNLKLTREWKENSCFSALKNVSDEPIRLKEVALFCGRFPVTASCPFYAEGFHMLSQHGGTLARPQNIGKYGTDEKFFSLKKSPFSPDTYTVYNMLLLSPTQLDRMLMAFASSFKFQGEFRFKNNYIEIVMDCEDLELLPGGEWQFEEFVALFGENRNELLMQLSARINVNHPRKSWIERTGETELPFGWCSYHCISGVKADEMYEQACAMRQRIPELKRIQIDDGYQSSTDWLIPNPASGGDMKEICAKIHELGCEPAGYLAPFTVNKHSVLFREHPDWLVMGDDGKPTQEHCFNKEWYILDGSNPKAVEYIRHVVRVMHDEWGMRYFKLDFTSYGALPGLHFDRNATRIEAFRRMFEGINEEVGADSYILGCNAPFWAQLGLVDGNRETNDIFRKWEIVRGNQEELNGRCWQNGTLWINDPDGVILEKRDRSEISNGVYSKRICELTDDEFEYHKAYIVACGGVVTSGDKLDEMSEHNLDVLRRMMRVAGDAAVYDDDTFEIGRIDKGDKHIICVFNNSDDVKSLAIPLAKRCKISDFWTDIELGEYDKHFTLFNVPPHSARVLNVY